MMKNKRAEKKSNYATVIRADVAIVKKLKDIGREISHLPETTNIDYNAALYTLVGEYEKMRDELAQLKKQLQPTE